MKREKQMCVGVPKTPPTSLASSGASLGAGPLLGEGVSRAAWGLSRLPPLLPPRPHSLLHAVPVAVFIALGFPAP